MMISGIGSGEFPDYIDVLKVPFVSVSTSSGRCNATRVSAVLVEGLKNWGVQTVNKWAESAYYRRCEFNPPTIPPPLDCNRVNVSAK